MPDTSGFGAPGGQFEGSYGESLKPGQVTLAALQVDMVTVDANEKLSWASAGSPSIVANTE